MSKSNPTPDYGPATEMVAAMKRLGHEVYEDDAQELNLNIVGVRNTGAKVDEFSCRMVVFWKWKGQWNLRSWPITTYPGSHYLITKLLNPKGAAILVPGQYKGVYALDLHGGRYRALCQRNGAVKVYRDGDRDRVFDLDASTIQTGSYGINIHAPVTLRDGLTAYTAAKVGAASAGCQVFQRVEDFLEFRDLCDRASEFFGNKFTYTLIRDSDLQAPLPHHSAAWLAPALLTTKDVVNAKDVSREGVELIQHFESCLKPVVGGFEAYPDPAHGWAVPTIGWGTIEYPTGAKVKRGDVITQRRADELLLWEIDEKAAGVDKLVTVDLNKDQRAALVSFAYNVGLGNLRSSTLLRKLNAGDFHGAADEFTKWNKAGGQVLRGLTRRRQSERNLFLGKMPFIVPE
jgi:lysozyme